MPCTFGFPEQLFCELDHLGHLHPREAFAHGKDDALVEDIQQDAPAGVSQLVKLFPVQQSPEVLPTFWFLQGMRRGGGRDQELGCHHHWARHCWGPRMGSPPACRVTGNVDAPRQKEALVPGRFPLPFLGMRFPFWHCSFL